MSFPWVLAVESTFLASARAFNRRARKGLGRRVVAHSYDMFWRRLADIKPIKNYLSKQSSVKQKPAWQEFEREGEENWDARARVREKGGEDRRLY